MTLRPQTGLMQRQRLGLTQEIKSSLQYLALAGLRLEQTLQNVIDSNPFLTVSQTHIAHGDTDWISSLSDPGPETLHVALRGLAADLFWRVEDRALANFLIDHVTETGLLEQPLAMLDRPKGVSLESLQVVRAVFLSEGGLLADDLGQCLSAQAQARADAGGLNLDTLAAVLSVCQNLSVSKNTAVDPDVLAVLQDLHMRPADQLDLMAAIILPPDLIVSEKAEGWHVQLNPLTHRHYHIDVEALAGLSIAAQKRPDIAEPLKVARATVRALQARGQTLINLTAFLCLQQDSALRTGRSALMPLTQGDAAIALSLHPSTISRAVAGKSVQTPQGVWSLRNFFTALIDSETNFSGAQLRAWLTQAIAGENRVKPISDATLATSLGVLGHKVARRTVTKYRHRLGLPGAADRRRVYARAVPPPNLTRKEKP